MKQLLTALFIFICLTVFANEDRTVVNARLQSVTVYRNGAEMIHVANATLKEGSNALVIEQLSNSIDVNSILIKVSDGITILGTEFSNNHLTSQVKTARVRLLEDSLEVLKKSSEKISLGINNINQLQDILKVNKDIKGTQTGVSVSELIKLMDYYKSKTTELQTELLQLQEKNHRIKEGIDKIQKELNEEKYKNTSSTGRIALQLQVSSTGKYTFDISYIALNASWNPFYDLRIEDIKSPIKLVYKANISQSTGIDWKQVKLSLSTATPGQSSNAPELTPWFLGYLNPYSRNRMAMAKPMAMMAEAKAETFSIEGYGSKKLDTKAKKLEEYVSVSDNIMNVTFDIDILYDIPTNGKEQTALLKTYQLQANYKHFAIPKLDKDAYLMAEVLDWEKLNLLPAEANVILEGAYTGKTFIDPNSSQDTLLLSLGKDKRVVLKRDKLVDFSSIKFLGTNKMQKFTFEITVRNNKKEAINLDLKDQFPLSTNKEIEVEMIDAGGSVLNNDNGVLNWLIKLPAGETKKFKFTYSIRYPKDKSINLN